MPNHPDYASKCVGKWHNNPIRVPSGKTEKLITESSNGSRPGAAGGPVHSVLLVEPDPDLRMLFAMQIGREASLSVAGEAAFVFEAVELASLLRPALVVMRLSANDEVTAADAARLLKEVAPACRIVLVSSNQTELDEAGSAVDELVMLSDARSVVPAAKRALARAETESSA